MKESLSGSYPALPDIDLSSETQNSATNGRRFFIGKESSAYQELRELRFPTVYTMKRNMKSSIKKLRCPGIFRSGSGGIVTYDDYTADLYGCDVDDELPLLVGSDADESTK